MDEHIAPLSAYRDQVGEIPRIAEGIEVDDVMLTR
jgi:hypothetical protein